MQVKKKTKDELLVELASLRECLAEQQRQMGLFRESEERYYKLFHHSAVGMFILRPDGSIDQANNAFCDFVGYSEPELFGKNILSITHPDDRERCSQAIASTFSLGSSHPCYEKRYLHKNGEAIWGEVSSTIICDVQKKPSYAIIQVLNINERKQTEEC